MTHSPRGFLRLKRQDSAPEKLRKATIYSATIVSLAIMVCAILIVSILPNLVQIFNEFHMQLPLPTRILLATGALAQAWRLQIIAATVTVIIDAYLLFQTHRGRVLLANSSQRIVEFLGEKMDYKLKLIELALAIAVGLAVGFIVLAVMMPMYVLLRAVH